MLYDNYGIILSDSFDFEDLGTLSTILASYLDDLVLDTNIWNTFVRLHKEKYNKWLPFFNTTNYYPEEVNPKGIRFLLWYFINAIHTERFIHPSNKFLVNIAYDVFELLDEEYETAPETPALKPY